MQVKIKALTGMLKEARNEGFTSADAVINFFEDKLINLCLEDFDKLGLQGKDNEYEFDIAKFKAEASG